jgi:hypothetical protein
MAPSYRKGKPNSSRRARRAHALLAAASFVPGSIIRRARFWLVGLVVALIAIGGLDPVPVEGRQPPDQRLAEKYAPVVYLRQQKYFCDRTGEGFFPAPIDAILDNPSVALRVADSDHSRTDTIVIMGPSAQDLAGLDNTHYLDFLGNPRRPGCGYERAFRQLVNERDLKPTAHARVHVDEERGKVALQYWLWYYFNDWNNPHESDWEMIQLVFDAATVEEALTQEPAVFAYAQHGGGELAYPGDDKLSIEGGRPVIYPTAGSHASHFDRHLYIGWGENGTGVGCDNATPPSTRMPLDVIFIPENPDPNGPFGWVYFEGRWGERQTWEYDGPTTPSMRPHWQDPVREIEGWRDSSLRVPDTALIGPSATGVFCSLSRDIATVLMYTDTHAQPLIASAALALGIVTYTGFYMRRSIWLAVATYARHWRVFLGIGLGTIPIGIVFNLIQVTLSSLRPFEWIVSWVNDTAQGSLIISMMFGSVQQLAMILIVVPAIIQAMADIDNKRRPGIVSSYLSAIRSFKQMIVALALVVTVSCLLLTTVIGVPIATWLLVRWQFFPQAIILNGAPSGVAALTFSARAVNRHWLRTFINTILFYVLAALPGPLIGMALLYTRQTMTIQTANTISSVVYAVVIPITVVGLTAFYQRIDVTARRTPVEDTPRRILQRAGTKIAPASP